MRAASPCGARGCVDAPRRLRRRPGRAKSTVTPDGARVYFFPGHFDSFLSQLASCQRVGIFPGWLLASRSRRGREQEKTEVTELEETDRWFSPEEQGPHGARSPGVLRLGFTRGGRESFSANAIATRRVRWPKRTPDPFPVIPQGRGPKKWARRWEDSQGRAHFDT